MKYLLKPFALFLIMAVGLALAQALRAQEVEKININQASAGELIQLKGIGPKLAERIVQYREEHGPFRVPEDIMKVKGIGPKTALKLIKQHGSIDNALSHIKKVDFPHPVEEIKQLFLNPRITEDYLLEWQEPDVAGLIGFLCAEHNFSQRRVMNAVQKMQKGIEQKTHLTMSGVIKENIPEVEPDRMAVISGPSFAREVAQKMPTSVTVACQDPEIAARVQHVFATPYFRVYTSDDVVGVELGGSVKNVIAIASGILDGLGMGLNTRAALITRGMTEVRRLGLHLGANPRTFTGLAGFGDLVLTCTGNLSRNYTVGIKLGKGKKLQQILNEMHMVAEGVKTAKSVYNFSRKLAVEMPICHEIYRILYEDLAPKEAVYRLMTRTLKQELDEE